MTAEAIAAAKPQRAPTVLPTEPVEAGKGGEGGDLVLQDDRALRGPVRFWRVGTGFRFSRQPLCNNPFMSLIVEVNAKGRTLPVSP
jgi:hypothetical protein